MSALATRESYALTEYKPQGLGHILKLSGIVTAGTILISVGGSALFAAPLALATVYQMFRSTGKVKDADWCKSRDELWHYKLSPKHKSIADAYNDWCKEWGKGTINSLIEPMIGNCELCNFTQDKKHPYHGLRGILTYDDEESAPLTPYDYVSLRLAERQTVLEKQDAVDVAATEVVGDSALPAQPLASGELPPSGEPISIAGLMHFFRLQNTLIWGGQGSGKTSLTREIAADKLKHGQKVIVLNPHGSAATWQGMKLMGAGKNYAAVEEFMRSYLALVKKRYQIFEQSGISEDDFLEQLLRAGLVETVICEEASSWAANVDQNLLHEFTQTGLTESRKVGLPLLIVTHDPSLSFMGLKKGDRLKNAGMAIVELEPGVPNLDTGFLKATGKGKLQLPGQKDAIHFVFTQPTMADLKAEGIAPPAISPNLLTAIQQPDMIEVAQPTSIYPGEARSPKQQLEQLYKLDVAEPTLIKEVAVTPDPQKIDFEIDDVLPELRPIVEYSIKQNGFIKAIDVKRNVKEFKAVSTEDIRNHFIGLVNQGYGVSQGDGDFLKYSAFGGVMGCDAITG